MNPGRTPSWPGSAPSTPVAPPAQRAGLVAGFALLCTAAAPLSACDGTFVLPGEGAAELSWQRGDEAAVQAVYDPLRASIRITPPVDGEVEVTFEQIDPFARLQLRVDASGLGMGSEVALPTRDDTLSLVFSLEDQRYLSTEPASGSLSFDELMVGEDRADVQASFDVVLTAEGEPDGPSLRLSGFIEAHYRPADADAALGE